MGLNRRRNPLKRGELVAGGRSRVLTKLIACALIIRRAGFTQVTVRLLDAQDGAKNNRMTGSSQIKCSIAFWYYRRMLLIVGLMAFGFFMTGRLLGLERTSRPLPSGLLRRQPMGTVGLIMPGGMKSSLMLVYQKAQMR